MARDIDSYLKELQAALAGADPALIQDALFDAEEHLQAEMAAGGDFATVTEAYGTPEEVAAAYLGTPIPREAAVPVTHAAVAEPAPAPAEAIPEAPAPGPGEQAPTASGAFPGEVGAPPVPPGAPGWPGGAGGPAAGPGGAYGTPAGPTHSVPAGVTAGLAAAAAGAAAPPSVWVQIFGVFADPAVYKALLYMIISLGTGIAYFTIVVTGLSTAGGMLILIIGFPLLLGVLGIVRAMALFEGRLVEILLGTRMPRRPRAEPPGAGFVQRMGFWLKDGRTWASMVYMVLMLPLGIAYFTIAVTGFATGLGLVTAPIWGWFGDHTFVYEGVIHDWWFPLWGIPLAVVVGALLLIGWMHLVRWIGRGHAAFAKAMLVRLAK